MASSRVRADARGRRRKPGRPRVLEEKWSKVSVVLFDRQIAQLDDFRSRMAKSGSLLNRAAIIRAALDVLLRRPVPRSIRSEADLRNKLSQTRRSDVEPAAPPPRFSRK
jgi:hypothetical protein